MVAAVSESFSIVFNQKTYQRVVNTFAHTEPAPPELRWVIQVSLTAWQLKGLPTVDSWPVLLGIAWCNHFQQTIVAASTAPIAIAFIPNLRVLPRIRQLVIFKVLIFSKNQHCSNLQRQRILPNPPPWQSLGPTSQHPMQHAPNTAFQLLPANDWNSFPHQFIPFAQLGLIWNGTNSIP